MVVSKERNNPLVKIFLAMFSEISLSVFLCFFFFLWHPTLTNDYLEFNEFQGFL